MNNLGSRNPKIQQVTHLICSHEVWSTRGQLGLMCGDLTPGIARTAYRFLTMIFVVYFSRPQKSLLARG